MPADMRILRHLWLPVVGRNLQLRVAACNTSDEALDEAGAVASLTETE